MKQHDIMVAFFLSFFGDVEQGMRHLLVNGCDYSYARFVCTSGLITSVLFIIGACLYVSY